MTASTVCDVLVVGAGVVGLNLALAWKERHPAHRVVLADKEAEVAAHASGRNSGVLHAGFYYTADSLKARFCRDGNRWLTDYCLRKGLPINRCGKLVVAKDETDLAGIQVLWERSQRNQVGLERIGEAEARRLEPRVRTVREALWSTTTSSVDPVAVMRSLLADAVAAGIDVRLASPYRGRASGAYRVGDGLVSAGHLVNAAGLYADRIAAEHGFGVSYRLLPFKGLYLYQTGGVAAPLTRHIYPVPDLAYPFLGVHFTITVDGHAKIGPTAIPALWREHYDGLSRFSLRECLDVVSAEAGLAISAGFDFRGLARAEWRKSNRRHLVGQAAVLADGIEERDFRRWGRPGIRAQLLDRTKRTLVMDFVIEGDAGSTHVLNAVSPAFTCARPFAEYVLAERAVTPVANVGGR